MFQMNLIRFLKMFSYVFLYKSLQGLAQVNRTWLSLIVGYGLIIALPTCGPSYIGVETTFGDN